MYQRRLHASNAVDFDDLLMLTVQVLERFPEARVKWQKAFRYILVDEYQDTNHAQYRLLQLLGAEHGNVCAVGDPDQSVYAFRGADIRNIMEFERDFPGTRVVTLEQNYRSTNTILRAANAVIDENRERKPKNLFSDLGEGEPVRVIEVEDEHAEARFVAAEIAGLIDNGCSASEIAVFYRTNAQSRVLEDVLVRQDVPYQVIGGPRFYERAEIRDATAYLTVLVNPSDAGSLLRIANRPRRGIGATSLARLVAYAEASGRTLFEAMADPEAAGVSSAACRAVRGFHATMESLMALAQELPVDELLERVLEKTGMLDALEAERTIEARGRIENLQELVGVAREYRQQTADASLAGFLQDVALVSDQDTIRDDRGLVTLMTLHNAKGLEFRAVFAIGMEEGIFPHVRAIEEQGVEEERRLCYVGMTRAMERLTLTHTMSRSLFGRRSYNLASRFLDELPSEVERERLRPSSWSGYGSPSSAAPRATPISSSRRGTQFATPRSARASSPRSSPVEWSRSASPRTGPNGGSWSSTRRSRRSRSLAHAVNLEYRSPSAEEFETVLRAATTAFGEELKDDELERQRKLMPLDRVLAAWDDGRPVGVAASYPFELTVPGGAAPRGRGDLGRGSPEPSPARAS